MRYELHYIYTTPNYHVYICESFDPTKNGVKFYLPRDTCYDKAQSVCDVIINGMPKDVTPTPRYARLKFRSSDD